MNKKGLLLLNLGTPDSTSLWDICRYLREFLMDPRVIDLPWIARAMIVYGIILPFRPRNTREAYQQIWTSEGSPLLTHSRMLRDKVAQALQTKYDVALGMRYGNPSIDKAAEQLAHCESITVLPLFPQYSSAATGSAIEKALKVLGKRASIPKVRVIDDFYDHPGFIQPSARLIQEQITHPDTFLVLSYHGIPERHIDKTGCHVGCDKKAICPVVSEKNAKCYRAQCYASTRAIAQALSLEDGKYMTTFQSRLGKTPWIQPYTDIELDKLYEKGIRHLAVACPSFTADCLETLEEIGIRAKEQWLSLGGESFTLIPCVNSEADWVTGIAELISQD